MKKINNKGFLLIETIIVSVFVLIIFVLLYRNSLPMSSIYQNRQRYDDIDSVYNANLFKKLTTRDSDIYRQILTRVDNEGYVDITNCEIFRTNEELFNTCNNLKNLTEVTTADKIYVTNWDLTIKGSNNNLLSNESLNRGMLEYLKYLNEQDEVNSPFDYRLILSRTVNHLYEEALGEYNDNEASIITKEKAITYYANIGL